MNEMKTKTRFSAYDANGKRYQWAFGRYGEYWSLRDPEGYVRVFEKTWIDTVPHIRTTLENYGMVHFNIN